MRSVFCVMKEELQLRIKEQQFYIEQSRARLLPPFANIEAEADVLEKEWVETGSVCFDPAISDISDVYEFAFHQSLEHYDLLQDMHMRTILSIVAGMYHQFDKSYRMMVARELHQAGWIIGTYTREIIWKCTWRQMEALMRAFGWDMTLTRGYTHLEAMRLVVNVFKHGEGVAFKDLKRKFPQFIPSINEGTESCAHVDHTYMKVGEENLEPFSEAILDFWGSVPNNLCIDSEVDALDVPKFYADALRADLKVQGA